METEAQADVLRQLGADEVQGNLYGRPEAPPDATERVWRELIPGAIPTSQGRRARCYFIECDRRRRVRVRLRPTRSYSSRRVTERRSPQGWTVTLT